MKDGKIRGGILTKTSRARLIASLRDFSSSPDGPKAWILFGGLLVMLVAISAINVVASYIGRDFMTAVASRDTAAFARETARFAGILFVAAATAAVFRWTEERLALLWREFLTRRLVRLYLQRHFYHRLGNSPLVANPDQRIADDVRVFTSTTLAFLLMILNATMSVFAFVGVLWTISPTLVLVAVTYATVGSVSAVWLGRPLIWINYDQSDREAELRADLVQLRENSEFVALAHHEQHFSDRLQDRVTRAIRNYRRLIAVNLGLNLFTNNYNGFIQIVPVLVVAPLYIRGDVEFGVITQSGMAFGQILGAFSLIVTQFQSISSFTAVVARVDRFSEAAHAEDDAPPPALAVEDSGDCLRFEHVTLHSADGSTLLVEDLTLEVDRGERVLVSGAGETAKMAFFRAVAGLWEQGRGRIVRPASTHCICLLPERPYLPPGTLREILAPERGDTEPTAERIHEILAELDLVDTVERIGGLDLERDWDDLLSLGELQRLAIARVLMVRPDFAVLDRIETTLDPGRLHEVLDMLGRAGITYIAIGRGDADLSLYDAVLDLPGHGEWTLRNVDRKAESHPGPTAGAA